MDGKQAFTEKEAGWYCNHIKNLTLSFIMAELEQKVESQTK